MWLRITLDAAFGVCAEDELAKCFDKMLAIFLRFKAYDSPATVVTSGD